VTGDKIVAVIAIIGMLALVVPRFINDPTPKHKLLQMIGLWVLVIVVITVVVITLA
jgi:heme/copper-type cytochrome/quinol oxidase subunit 1